MNNYCNQTKLHFKCLLSVPIYTQLLYFISLQVTQTYSDSERREGYAPASHHMLGDLFTASCLVRDQHPVKSVTLKRAASSPEP